MRNALLLACCLLFACEQADPVPEGLIEKPLFTEVLARATLIEARMNQELTTEAKTSIPVMRYYDDLFKEKGVTREAFERTFDYYAARPLEMKAIYDDVLATLRRQKDEAAQRPAPETKADTLAADSANVRKL